MVGRQFASYLNPYSKDTHLRQLVERIPSV